MNFTSDNVTGIAPEIMAALAAANEGAAVSYGDDTLTKAIETKVADVFETKADVILVTTGTAANAIALAAMAQPFCSIFCHEQSHIHMDECGAPEFYAGGAKLMPLPGAQGRIAVADMERVLDGMRHGVHNARPTAVSITQSTETGTVYSRDAIRAISDFAHANGMKVQMDGSRFANALVSLGCSPAEMTWKAGVDVLCFGASKNGALAVEAIVCFDPALAETMPHRRKRGGHLVSKGRFLAAQFDAYLKDDLWLRHARHANAMAKRLSEGLASLPGTKLLFPVEANAMFITLTEAMIAGLHADGFVFSRWNGTGPSVRLVCAYNTQPATVDAFIASARKHGKAGA